MVEELAKREAPGFLTGVYSPESVKGLSYTIRKALDFEAADPPEAFAFFTADTPEFSSSDIREFLEAFLASGRPLACVPLPEKLTEILPFFPGNMHRFFRSSPGTRVERRC